jgi:hypothetical protein
MARAGVTPQGRTIANAIISLYEGGLDRISLSPNGHFIRAAERIGLV